MAKLRLVLYNLDVGESIEVHILRDNKEKVVNVVLLEIPKHFNKM